MNLKEQLIKLNLFSSYVYLVSTLMIGQIIVHKINEQSDWIIRKGFLNFLPTSMHEQYFGLMFILLMFSIIHIIIIPIVGTLVGVINKNRFIVFVSFTAAVAYYLFLQKFGDGLI